MICKYITKRNRRIGVVVADVVNDNTYNIEYAVCCPEDKYIKGKSVELAYERCHGQDESRTTEKLHSAAVPYYLEMIERASRYFKGCKPSERVKFVENKYKK